MQERRERIADVLFLWLLNSEEEAWGVASKFLSFGAFVPWLKGGIDTIATQALANLEYGVKGLQLLEKHDNSWLSLITLFALIIFFMDLGNGMFASPNTVSIMNSVPPKYRGTASGMRSTLQNSGQTTITIISLASTLPSNAVTQAGAPQLASYMQNIPVTGALFAAFLGYDPVRTIISSLPPQVPSQAIAIMEQRTWFPMTIAPSFMIALREAFYISSIMTFIAAIVSALRGKVVIAEVEKNKS